MTQFISPMHVEPKYRLRTFLLYIIIFASVGVYIIYEVLDTFMGHTQVKTEVSFKWGDFPDLAFCPGAGNHMKYAYTDVQAYMNNDPLAAQQIEVGVTEHSTGYEEPCLQFNTSSFSLPVGVENKINILYLKITFSFEKEFNQTKAKLNSWLGVPYTEHSMRAIEVVGGKANIVGYLGAAAPYRNTVGRAYEQKTVMLHKEMVTFANGDRLSTVASRETSWVVNGWEFPSSGTHVKFLPKDRCFISDANSPNDPRLYFVDVLFGLRWAGAEPSVEEDTFLPRYAVLFGAVSTIGGFVAAIGIGLRLLLPPKFPVSRIVQIYDLRTWIGQSSNDWEPELDSTSLHTHSLLPQMQPNSLAHDVDDDVSDQSIASQRNTGKVV